MVFPNDLQGRVKIKQSNLQPNSINKLNINGKYNMIQIKLNII